MTSDQFSAPEFGSLLVPFPPGWNFEYQDQCPIEGSGPNNGFALISFSEASANADEDALRSHFKVRVALVEEMLLAVAEERGTPYGKMSVFLEKGGKTFYSMASTTNHGGVEGYFLQYVCVSFVSQHYINIGGQGAIDDMKTSWDDIIRRSTWVNEA